MQNKTYYGKFQRPMTRYEAELAMFLLKTNRNKICKKLNINLHALNQAMREDGKKRIPFVNGQKTAWYKMQEYLTKELSKKGMAALINDDNNIIVKVDVKPL